MKTSNRVTRKPEFFVLGAPKCGTTALASYLATHSSIQISQPKEPNYFCKDLSVGGLSVASDEEYLAKFFPGLDNSSALAALDVSVWYLYLRVAVDAILLFRSSAQFFGDAAQPCLNRLLAAFDAALGARGRSPSRVVLPLRCSPPRESLGVTLEIRRGGLKPGRYDSVRSNQVAVIDYTAPKLNHLAGASGQADALASTLKPSHRQVP